MMAGEERGHLSCESEDICHARTLWFLPHLTVVHTKDAALTESVRIATEARRNREIKAQECTSVCSSICLWLTRHADFILWHAYRPIKA
jgi:hypothetical protein